MWFLRYDYRTDNRQTTDGMSQNVWHPNALWRQLFQHISFQFIVATCRTFIGKYFNEIRFVVYRYFDEDNKHSSWYSHHVVIVIVIIIIIIIRTEIKLMMFVGMVWTQRVARRTGQRGTSCLFQEISRVPPHRSSVELLPRCWRTWEHLWR